MEEKCNNDPSDDNVKELEIAKIEYEMLYDYVVQGSIIRSRAEWCEKGEKSNKYFLSLESRRSNKNCIRKIYDKKGKQTSNPKVILDEIESFYFKLYTETNSNCNLIYDWHGLPLKFLN